jgi:hypothetical protein
VALISSASQDGRDDRQFVTVANWRVEAAVKADVFVVEIDADVLIWLAFRVALSRRSEESRNGPEKR